MKQKFYFLKQFKHLTKRMLLLLVSIIFVGSLYAQERTITGSITDKAGVPLPGVNVVLKGATSGAITDLDGKFSIRVPGNDAVLSITYVGYIKQEVPVGEQTVINVQMEEEVKVLSEVVVVGYGVQKKSDLTGAVASVSGDNLKKVPAIGVDQALQGRAAGVNIISNTGMPGGSSTIQIRGISSMNGTKPLVIIDGVPSSVEYLSQDLNAGDIESLEVLKDASSSAIYGATGGNGVILVTTKKGKSGKTVTTFDYYRGWQNPWKEIEMCNSQQYVEMRNNIAAMKYANTSMTAPFVPYSDRPDTFPYYNWQDVMLRTSVMENYDFSISGGNEKSTFMIRTNYMQQQGILRKSDFSRFGLRINSDHKLSKLFKIGENASFVYTKLNGYREADFTSEYAVNNTGVFQGVLTMYPFIPAYNDTGGWAMTPDGSQNPKIAEDIKNRQEYRYKMGGNAYIDFNLFKGFTYTTNLSSYVNFDMDDEYKRAFSYSPTVFNTQAASSVYKLMAKSFGWTFQNYATYSTKVFTDNNISLMAGMESHFDNYLNMSGTRKDIIDLPAEMRYFDAARDNASVDQFVRGGASDNESSTYAYFGRLNYDYKGKYLATFNYRKDYSSRFGPENRSGVFPSYSFGWKFSEEEFMKSVQFLSFGKVRYGWGKTGANAPGIYSYYATVVPSQGALRYEYDTTTFSEGSAPVKVANRAIQWESMIMTSVGLDLGFFNNKLNITADYFNRHSEKMFLYKDLPAPVGVYQFLSDQTQLGGEARPLVNAGTMLNKGFEFSIGYKKAEGELKSSFDLNITFASNEMTEVGADSIAYGRIGVNLANFVINKKGNPVAQFYGLKTNGIFTEKDAATRIVGGNSQVYVWNQPYTINATTGDTVFAQPSAKPGDLRYVDMNGDGRINDQDKVMIGNPSPKFTFGFSCNFEYKNFDLNLFFQGSYGNKIFNGSKFYLMGQDVAGNYMTSQLNQYRSPVRNAAGELVDPGNTNTSLFRLDPRGQNGNLTRVSDIYVEDGSYVRLKSIQLGYTIPKSICSKFGVESLRFYVGAKNLLTFTNYTGFDPEIGNNDITGNSLLLGIDKGGVYPQPRVFLAGVNLKF